MVTILTPIYGCCLLVRLSLFLKACQTESWHGSLQVSGIIHSPSRGKKKGNPSQSFLQLSEKTDFQICNLSYSPHLFVETKKGRAKAAVQKSPRKNEQNRQPGALALSPELLPWVARGSRGDVHKIHKGFAQCFAFFPFYFGHGTSDKAVFVGKTSRGTPIDQWFQCLWRIMSYCTVHQMFIFIYT